MKKGNTISRNIFIRAASFLFLGWCALLIISAYEIYRNYHSAYVVDCDDGFTAFQSGKALEIKHTSRHNSYDVFVQLCGSDV